MDTETNVCLYSLPRRLVGAAANVRWCPQTRKSGRLRTLATSLGLATGLPGVHALPFNPVAIAVVSVSVKRSLIFNATLMPLGRPPRRVIVADSAFAYVRFIRPAPMFCEWVCIYSLCCVWLFINRCRNSVSKSDVARVQLSLNTEVGRFFCWYGIDGYRIWTFTCDRGVGTLMNVVSRPEHRENGLTSLVRSP